MSFKNFKSPTVKNPYGGFYERTVDYLLSVRKDSPELYRLLDSQPQFEYEIPHYFNSQKLAKTYMTGLDRFLRKQGEGQPGRVPQGMKSHGPLRGGRPTDSAGAI